VKKARIELTGSTSEAAYSVVVGPGKVSNCDGIPRKLVLSEISLKRYRIR
jgi:hypothetical protein